MSCEAKKQDVHVFIGLCDYYSALFAWMAALNILKAVAQSLLQLWLSLLLTLHFILNVTNS